MTKRWIAALCALVFCISLCFGTAMAEDEPAAWWEADIWEAEQLVSLGAEPPVYNAETKQYEISTPEQLLYLSGLWKLEDTNGDGAPDAPCDGTYVLTADLDMSALMGSIGTKLSALAGKAVEGYMPPIAASCDAEQDEGVHCAFYGTFDGQGHAVSHINIVRLGDKYCGFFGNVGHDFGEGFVKNLALLDIHMTAKASCGLIAGAVYGDIDNCVVIGRIDCLEKTAGGIAGKVKKNDNGYIGTVRNCFVYADIRVYGEGSENGAAGGVTSAQSDGGRIYNCYVGGSIEVTGRKAESVGGISGNLKSGQALENCVMLLKNISVEDGSGIGLLCGDYSGETGSHLVNNYVWNGTQLSGHVTNDHPETAAYADADAATIRSKAFYTDTLLWDFDTLWTWIGADDAGYPMLSQFAESQQAAVDMETRISADLLITAPVLRASEPMTNAGFEGEDVTVSCTLTLPEGAACGGVTLHYGADKDGSAYPDSVAMTDNGDGTYSAVFPEKGTGVWYYYFSADVSGTAVTFPNALDLCVRYEILSLAGKRTPKQVTVCPGKVCDEVGIAWITDEGGLTASVRCRETGAESWMELPVSDIYDAELPGGHGAFTSYSIDVTGLKPGTAYEYQAVTNDGTEEYATEICTFTTLTDKKEFSFLLVSDLQGTTEEAYKPFDFTMDSFVKDTLGGTDFVINLGDLTEDGSSMPQWKYMFNTLGEYYANALTMFAPGNHESKGDPNCTMFKAVTNLPGGVDDPAIGETTGSFIVGDVCFVILNTEPYSGAEGADVAAERTAFYQMQKDWAKSVFEASGCRWRIVCAHAGLIQDDPVATAFLEQMCDELNVDLYFNGHIHNYYRAAVRDGQPAETGAGTTFITTSPMGLKFDDFTTGVIDDLLQFQNGGSADERQYFTQVKVGADGVTVTAYQRTVEGDPGKKSSFLEFTAIDSITLTESLSERYAPEAEPTAAPAEAAPEAAASAGGAIWWIVGAAAAVVIAVVVTVALKKKKQSA